jgi:hypothetical protein
MLAFQINLSFFALCALVLIAFVAGYLLNTYRIKEYRHKILELEKDMLSCHAQILELEREKSNLIQKTSN